MSVCVSECVWKKKKKKANVCQGYQLIQNLTNMSTFLQKKETHMFSLEYNIQNIYIKLYRFLNQS